jgi:putative copper export protein/mono/diheme cytochrome c family protein
LTGGLEWPKEHALSDLLVAARFVHVASAISLTGTVIFWFFVAEPVLSRGGEAMFPLKPRAVRLLYPIVQLSLLAAILSSVAWLLILAADIGGQESVAPVWTFLIQTAFGWVWVARAVIALALVPLALQFDAASSLRSPVFAILLVGLCVCYSGLLAWSGHALATDSWSGIVHRVADLVHVLAAGAWVGSLLPLAMLLGLHQSIGDRTAIVALHRAVRRFSTIGVFSVGALLITGGLNTWFLAGTLPALLGTYYGHVLLVKIALFVAMLCLAAVNRLRFTPRIAMPLDGDVRSAHGAANSLIRNCVLEATLGFAVILIVALLGTLPPGMHEQPWWPLPFRFIADAYFDPDLRTTAVLTTAMTAIGLLLIVAAAMLRRGAWRIASGLAGLVMLVFFGRDLSLFVTSAYPTTFYAPAVRFSAQSLALGQNLFAAHCAECHGPAGNGDGPPAKNLATPPADLTADHIYGHSDGDLFWILSNGTGGVMPPFGPALDEEARWHIINFVHANADAVRLAALRGRVTYAAFPAPAFTVECPDGGARTPEDFSGKPVHIVIAGAGSADRLRQLSALALSGAVTTLVVMLEESGRAARKFCSTADRDLIAILGLYRGAAASLEGTEFLLDGSWQIRAMWHPGLDTNWIDPLVFRHNIAAMENPQVLPSNLTALTPASEPRTYFPGTAASRYYSHQH